ncbi:MAG: hypothetical protein AAGL69_02645 [Pseudomonadota bacterium]
MNQSRPIALLLLSVVGMLALIVFEIMRGMIGAEATEMMIPLVIMVCIACSPVILLTAFSARWAYWSAMVVAALLSAFHALHLVEHAVGGDYAILALIVVAMLIPTASATYLLWNGRSESPGHATLLAAS